MRIGRTIPPAASPISIQNILHGIQGLMHGQREVDRFKAELREHFGARHCYLLSSGKAALALILLALKQIYPGRDEVLIPAFSCYSVPSAIIRTGLKVRLCDISSRSFDYDFDKLRQTLSQDYTDRSTSGDRQAKLEDRAKSRLLAILSVHLFGLPADVKKLRILCQDREVTIIEDAAQGMGGTLKGQKLGTLGDVSFFSLGRGKSLSTVEGGVILTNSDMLAEKLEKLVSSIPGYGSLGLIRLILSALFLSVFTRPSLFWIPKSMPFLKLGSTIYDPKFIIKKMSGFQAGIAKGWKNKIQTFKNKRSNNSRSWADLIKNGVNLELGNFLFNHQSDHLIRFPIKINRKDRRETILRTSEKSGLGIVAAYPDSIDGIGDLKGFFNGETYPKAKEMAHRVITLPVHPLLSNTDIQKISELIFENKKI